VITGGGDLNLLDDFTWTGGTISVGGGVTVGAGQSTFFTVAGPNPCTLASNLTNNSPYFDVNSPLTIAAGLTFTNASSDIDVVDLSSTIGGAGTFANQGVLECNSTTVAAAVTCVLAESGSIQMGAGAMPLTLGGPGTLAGDLTLNGATLLVTGAYTVAANTKLETMYGIQGLSPMAARAPPPPEHSIIRVFIIC
jgi:hypothetical protein